MATAAIPCRVCRSSGPHPAFQAREMVFGLKDSFDYCECTDCGTVQIVTPLCDAEIRNYCAARHRSMAEDRRGRVGRWISLQRDRATLGQRRIFGALASRIKPNPFLSVLCKAGIRTSDRILDVGCGHQDLLDELARAGFQNLMGADPYARADMTTPAGVAIRGCPLEDVTDIFEVVMFNHSLEHMADPVVDLTRAANRLERGGLCIVRIPTPSSEAWEAYREHWVQLDAPRHAVLPSRRGMSRLAERAGFTVAAIIDDSSEFQFLGSELYRLGIPLVSQKVRAAPSLGALRALRRKARRANAAGRGDQAAFVLRRA